MARTGATAPTRIIVDDRTELDELEGRLLSSLRRLRYLDRSRYLKLVQLAETYVSIYDTAETEDDFFARVAQFRAPGGAA